MSTTLIRNKILEQINLMDFQTVKEYSNYILGIAGIYLLWISVHYITPHLYVYFCVPPTIIGLLMSPFTSTMPHCQGLRWLLYTSSDSIKAMWFVLSAWCFGKIQNYMTTSEKNILNTEENEENEENKENKEKSN